MRFKKALAAAIGLSMVATPVLAQSASPLSISRSAAVMQNSGSLEDEGYLLPALIIVAVLAAAILLTNSGGSDDLGNPQSP